MISRQALISDCLQAIGLFFSIQYVGHCLDRTSFSLQSVIVHVIRAAHRFILHNYPCFMDVSYRSEPPIPWSAARCNRILRPLASKLNTLRRSATAGSTQIHDWPRGRPIEEGQAGHVNDDDLFAYRKKLKRDYGVRHTSCEGRRHDNVAIDQSSSQDSTITLPTPFTTRSRLGDYPGESADLSQSRSTHETAHKGRKRKRQAFSGTNIFDGILDVFISLLLTTDEFREKPIDNRSLFAMSLRQIPQSIEDEVNWRKIENPDDNHDVSAEYYNELERLDVTDSGGWHGLRVVVRSQGIRLLCNSIKDKTLTFTMVRDLLAACDKLNALDARQSIVEAYLSVRYARTSNDRTCEEHESHMIGSTWCLLRGPSPTKGFRQFRQMTLMMKSKRLSLLAFNHPEFFSAVNTAMRLISRSANGFCDATSFLEIALFSSACGAPERHADSLSPASWAGNCISGLSCIPNPAQALHRITAGICKAIGAIVVIGLRDKKRQHGVNYYPNPCLYIIRSASVSIIADFASEREFERATRTGMANSSLSVLLVDMLLLVLMENDTCTFAAARSRRLIQMRLSLSTKLRRQANKACLETDNSEDPCDILGEIANSCERVCPGGGFSTMRQFVNYLLETLESSTKADEGFAKQLAVGSAFAFADRSPAKAHQAFAENVASSVGMIGLTPAPLARETRNAARGRKRKRDGASPFRSSKKLRWDTGICEWVVASPARSLAVGTSEHSSRGNELETPRGYLKDETESSDAETAIVTPLPAMVSSGSLSMQLGQELPPDLDHLPDEACGFIEIETFLTSPKQSSPESRLETSHEHLADEESEPETPTRSSPRKGHSMTPGRRWARDDISLQSDRKHRLDSSPDHLAIATWTTSEISVPVKSRKTLNRSDCARVHPSARTSAIFRRMTTEHCAFSSSFPRDGMSRITMARVQDDDFDELAQ